MHEFELIVQVWRSVAPLLSWGVKAWRRRRQVSGERREHGSECSCTRCAGFGPANPWRVGEGERIALKHGAYSEREIEPLQQAILENLERVSPIPSPADDPARRVLAGRLAQIEIARRWVLEHGVCDDEGELRPIVRELAKWESGARVMLRELGLTTLSRSELGLNLAETHVALGEVQGVIQAVVLVAGRFVPEAQRDEFSLALDEAMSGLADGARPRELSADGVIEVGPVDES